MGAMNFVKRLDIRQGTHQASSNSIWVSAGVPRATCVCMSVVQADERHDAVPYNKPQKSNFPPHDPALWEGK